MELEFVPEEVKIQNEIELNQRFIFKFKQMPCETGADLHEKMSVICASLCWLFGVSCACLALPQSSRAHGRLWEPRVCLLTNHYRFLTLKTGANSSSSKRRKTLLYLASKSSTVTSWFWSLSLLNPVLLVSAALVVSPTPLFFTKLVHLAGEDSGYVEVEDVGTFMFLPEVMSSPYPCWWAKAYAERRELVLRTLLRFCS